MNNGKISVDTVPVTIAYGDGIGPEIMESVLKILQHADAKIRIETVEIGEPLYKKGFPSGISDDGYDIIKRNAVFLKSPITTPQGGGYKSLNVTIRRILELYANVRPCVAYAPFVPTHFPNMNITIIRENVEDLYSGVEYRQTHNVYHAIKIVSMLGCERIIRYAFEYAKKHSRKKVTCFSKDNIMKMTDGLFHRTFDRIAKEYPDIANENYIVDIGTARLATNPDIFDVIVTMNLYGDIISDVAAEMTGSVGLAGSANIGKKYAMFEAIHGSAPTMINQDIANPTALLNAAIMMLCHIGQGTVAQIVQNALMCTLESGIHTHDISKKNEYTKKTVGTKEFTNSIIANLGNEPKKLLKAPSYPDFKFDGIIKKDESSAHWTNVTTEKKVLVGVDLFIDTIGDAKTVGEKISSINHPSFDFVFMSLGGMKIFPGSDAHAFCSDHYRARFLGRSNANITYSNIIDLMKKVMDHGIDIIKSENLYKFDDINGFTPPQGG